MATQNNGKQKMEWKVTNGPNQWNLSVNFWEHDTKAIKLSLVDPTQPEKRFEMKMRVNLIGRRGPDIPGYPGVSFNGTGTVYVYRPCVDEYGAKCPGVWVGLYNVTAQVRKYSISVREGIIEFEIDRVLAEL